MDKTLVQNFLETLMDSWGCDTPPEAIWSANKFINIIENQYKITIPGQFVETEYDPDSEQNNKMVQLILKAIT